MKTTMTAVLGLTMFVFGAFAAGSPKQATATQAPVPTHSTKSTAAKKAQKHVKKSTTSSAAVAAKPAAPVAKASK